MTRSYCDRCGREMWQSAQERSASPNVESLSCQRQSGPNGYGYDDCSSFAAGRRAGLKERDKTERCPFDVETLRRAARGTYDDATCRGLAAWALRIHEASAALKAPRRKA